MSHAADSNTHRIRSVLVVDDDVELAMMYKELLGSQGYIVHTAPNGVEALKLIMRHEVDAIICDMMTPHMAGDTFYMAVERVKQLANLDNPELIELSPLFDFGHFLRLFGKAQARPVSVDLGVRLPTLRPGCLYSIWTMAVP